MKKRIIIGSSLALVILGLAVNYQRLADYWDSRRLATISPNRAFASTTGQPAPVQRIEGKPVAIAIPSLKLDLPVVNGYYNEQAKVWTLSNDKAHFATLSPQPNNQEGNTFIYGHNRKEVFAKLLKIQPGAEVIVTTENNHRFTYKFVGSYVTSPDDSRLFNYRGAPILTLQTCSGLWYQNRQLFRFDLVKVD